VSCKNRAPLRGALLDNKRSFRNDLLGDSPLDDVADPYGGSSSAYEAAVTEIEDLVDRLVSLFWPVSGGSHRPPGTSGAQAVPS
jgi:protein-tyrosine-phosphatase